jgi:hypothetical protein
MRLVKQKQHIAVPNYDVVAGAGLAKKNNRRHGALLPDTIRCIVSGSSGSGKTNVVFSLLYEPNGLRYKNVYVFSKSLYQPKYRNLEKVMSGVPEIGYFPFSENEQVLPPEEARRDSVFIFDDVIEESQANIRKYFTRGRHNRIDVFYLTQSYAKTPKHLIRDNSNFLILFKQDELNLQHVYKDHVSGDMEWRDFKSLCDKAWNDNKHGFVVVDKEGELNKGRYRIGFDTFIAGVER